MWLSTRAMPGIALTCLGFWCAGRALGQEPIPASVATPQRSNLPVLPEAPGAGASAPSIPGLESSAFGPNSTAASVDGTGGPSGVFGSGAGAGGFASGLGGFAGASGAAPGIIGDFSPPIAIRAVAGLPQPPPIPPPGKPSSPSLPSPKYRSQLSPSVRGFKIAENQSPFPQDRVFFTFNYFNNVNAKLDKYFASPIDNLNIYRYVFGYEKTFNDGKGSIGLRLPLNSIHADTSPGLINQGGRPLRWVT